MQVYVFISSIIVSTTASPLIEAIYNGAGTDTDTGLSALHVAVSVNNYEACEFLIKAGVDLNAVDSFNASPLLYAVAANNLKLVNLLLKSGVDAHHKDNDGRMALHIAAKKGNGEISKAIFINSGKRVKAGAKDKYGWTTFHYAASAGHDEIINLYASASTPRNAREYTNDMTPLQVAIITGYPDAAHALIRISVSKFVKAKDCQVELLLASHYAQKSVLLAILDTGCDIESQDDNGNTALINATYIPESDNIDEHIDACNKSAEIVKTLLLAGANLQAINKEGKNAFMLALERKNHSAATIISKEMAIKSSRQSAKTILPAVHFEITEKIPNLERIRSLVSPENINETDVLDRTAAHVAVGKDNVEIVRELIPAGCDLSLKQAHGNTVLHLAKSVEMARVLINCDKSLTNAVNEEGNTPLQVSILNKLDDLACLLAAETTDIGHYNKMNYSALDFTCDQGRVDIAKCLLRYGAGEKIMPKPWGPLHIAAFHGYVEISKLLLENGLKTTSPNLDGSLPAHKAAIAGRFGLIPLLMEGVKPNVTDVFGNSLLHYAAHCSNGDVINILVKKFGVPINMMNFGGLTALRVAIMSKHVDTVKAIIDNGADLTLGNNSGKTALYYAMQYAASWPCAFVIAQANRDLIFVKSHKGRGPLYFILKTINRRTPRINMKFIATFELTASDIPEGELKTALIKGSGLFVDFLDALTRPITFEEYTNIGVEAFKEDSGLNDNSTLESYVLEGLGNFYAFAADYYPQLASKEVPETETGRLNSKKEEYRDAVKAYEKVKHKLYYTTKLRYMMVESFMSEEGCKRLLGTYMDLVPKELVDDVLVGVTNNGNVLGRLELLANAMMLTLKNREEIDSYSDYLGGKMNRLSDVILPKHTYTFP